MPQRNKDGLDWPNPRARYVAGESASSLAKEFDVTRQGIAKRAKREGWWDESRVPDQTSKKSRVAPQSVSPAGTDPVTPAPAPVIVTKGKGKSPLDRYGLRTPENAELAVKLAMEGKTYALIAPRLGMTPSALKQWRDDDPAFNTALQDAMAVYVGERLDDVTKASQRGDTRAAQWTIERHPLTRDELGSGKEGGSGPTINVILNVPRNAEQLEVLERMGRLESTKIIDAEAAEVV